MREFYLKGIVLVIKDKRTASRFASLEEAFRQQGIFMQIYSVQEEFPLLPETLYITDACEIGRYLRKKDLSVLGFSHEDSDSLPGITYVMEEPEELDTEYLERVYRRYRSIPWDILETERCYLRESSQDDAEAFLAIYASPNITKYTEGLFPDLEKQKSYLKDYIDKMYGYYEFGVWTVLSKETGEIIGRAGFSLREGYELPELGFVIGEPWQRKGIAYEICSAILEYGWESYGFDEVQVLVMPENTASMNLCRKLGFIKEEKIREKKEEYAKLTIEKPVL